MWSAIKRRLVALMGAGISDGSEPPGPISFFKSSLCERLRAVSRSSSEVPSQAASQEVVCQSAGGLRGHHSVSAVLIVHENE